MQPPPRSHPTHSLWRARFHHHEPPATSEERHMIKPGGPCDHRSCSFLLWLSSLCYLLKEGGGGFKQIVHRRETESDSWGWSSGMGNPPQGSECELQSEPAKTQPELLQEQLYPGWAWGKFMILRVGWISAGACMRHCPHHPNCAHRRHLNHQGPLLRTEARTLAVPLSSTYRPSS